MRGSADTTKRRKRWGPLAAPAERADLYWGTAQPELQGITDAQLTALLMETPEFEAVLTSELDAIDQRNRNLRGNQAGRPSRFSSRQLEGFLLYRRIAGLETIKRTRERLYFDREAQQLLGFENGLPSLKTMSRYMRERIDETKRALLYRELDRQLRQRVVALPGFDTEARILGLDGSKHGTRFTPPIRKRAKNGKLTKDYINSDIPTGQPGAVTAESAGHVGGDNPKSGKGWQFMGLFTEHGTLVGWEIAPLNESEPVLAESVLDAYEEEVLPHRGIGTLSVCTADGAFSSPTLRARLQELRIAPNIHRASHADKPSSAKHVKKLSKEWLPFKHPTKSCYANWSANGHMELRCKCQAGSTEKVFKVSKTGRLSIAVKGHCSKCGNVTITAGKWRRAQNPDSFVRSFAGEAADPAIGNGLTYFDVLSRELGKDRFGFGESVHATIERRWGLLKDKSWMRDIKEVEVEFAIASSAMSVLLLERAKRQQAAAEEESFAEKPQLLEAA